jgi:hypothetical protein
MNANQTNRVWLSEESDAIRRPSQFGFLLSREKVQGRNLAEEALNGVLYVWKQPIRGAFTRIR